MSDTNKTTSNNQEGKVQVSLNRSIGFYVRCARRFLAGADQVVRNSIHITALGGAIPNAISVAHEVQEAGPATIEKVVTFYTQSSSGDRKVARVEIFMIKNNDFVDDIESISRPAPAAVKTEQENAE